MEMTTMERLFLEIFDRKNRIERQLHQQLESYSQSLACDIVAQGGRPPPWLWETGQGTAICPDTGGLNREQLVSGIFFPNPLANTSLEDPRTYFIVPDMKYSNVCKPNNLLCDARMWQDERKCMASGTHLQTDNLKDSDSRKESVSGLEKGSKCTCSHNVSRKIEALQLRKEGSLCGACVSLADIQLLKGDIVTTAADLIGNDAHTAPTKCQGEREEIFEVAYADYNIEPASNGYKPSGTPVVSSSRLESESHKHTLSSQVSDSSTFNSPSTYMENGGAKTLDPARMDIILRSDDCSVGITEDDIAGSCRVNVSVLLLSLKDSASPSSHRIIAESNFLDVQKDGASPSSHRIIAESNFLDVQKDGASPSSHRIIAASNFLDVEDLDVKRITSFENNNNSQGRYFSRSSSFVSNATFVKPNASVLSSCDGDSKLLEVDKVEIASHNVEKSMTKKLLASGYGESHGMASEGRYFLRSSTIHNKNLSLHKSDGAYCVNELNNVEAIDHKNEYSWPKKRNMKHKSSNILATSPRSRARSFLELKHHNRCKLKTGNNYETGMPLQSASKLITIQMPTAAPSESQQNDKSHLLEHVSDLNLQNCYLMVSPTEVRQSKTPHIVEEYSSVCSRDKVMTTNLVTSESEVHHTSGGAENVLPFMDAFQMEASKYPDHHDRSDEGEEPFDAPQNMYKCGMAGISNIDGVKANYNASMPEFEKFTMNLPYRLENNIVCKAFDIPSHAKEQPLNLDQSFSLEQLYLSKIMLTPRSELSMMKEVDDISDGFHLSPLGMLDNTDMDFSLVQDMANVEHLGASSSHKLMGISCNVGPQSGGPGPEMSHSQSSLSTRLGSEYRKPPLTPPVLKLRQDRLSGKRNSSSLKMSSESEHVCFRIDENSSTTEVNADIIQVDHATHLASPRKIEVSTSSKALSDVTAVYQHGTGSISNYREFVLRDSLESVNSEVGFSPGFGYVGSGNSELENKENPRNLDTITRPENASESLSTMSENSKVSCKSRERSGSCKNTTDGCKPSNILSNVSSFVPRVRQKQQGVPPLYGKKDVKVKALEIAEAARRLEEKKQIARESKKAAAKLEREKLEREKAKQLELKQKLKEEEKKKKEADVAARKRHREEEERKVTERKRQRIEETSTLQREREDKFRQGKGKYFQEKFAKQKGRKQATNVKRQHKLEKEGEPNGKQIAPGVQHYTIQSSSCATEFPHCIIQDLEVSNENTYIAKGASSSDVIPEVIEDISPTRKCQDSQSYEMSPYQNSEDGDFEDDSWRKNKYIPLWARRESLASIITSIQHLHPKQIFCRKRSFNIPEVLFTRVLRRPLP